MKEDKTTQSFLQAAYDVLSGNVKSFHQQAQEEYFEMWLNDDMELTEVQEQKLIDLYTHFENNEISEKELEDGILGAIGRGIKSGAKKVVKRLSTQGRTDAAKKKIQKLKSKSDAKKKKAAQKSALKRTKSALQQAKKKYK